LRIKNSKLQGSAKAVSLRPKPNDYSELAVFHFKAVPIYWDKIQSDNANGQGIYKQSQKRKRLVFQQGMF
jgi:hypothetical protein